MGDLIKQDINFLEYPLWLQDEELSNKTEGYVWKDREGYIYRAGYKPPVKTDFLFLLSLLLQSQQEEWKDEILTTKYKILQLCGISRNKIWYERLEDSLERWKMVGIQFQGTFYDGKNYQTLHFGIIDAWGIDKETNKLKIRFSPEWLLRIKESNFFKYINFDQIKVLRSPLVVRLYEILIKNFQGRKVWQIDAEKLAKKIPMNEKYPAHIVPKIEAAVKRISKHTNLKIHLTVDRSKRGKAILIFEKMEIEAEVKKTDLPNDDLFKKLLEFLPGEYHRTKEILETLAKYYQEKGFDYVRTNLQYASQNSTENYPAYLSNALEKNWGIEIQARETKEVEKKKREINIRELAEKVKNGTWQEYQFLNGKNTYKILGVYDSDPNVMAWSLLLEDKQNRKSVTPLKDSLDLGCFKK